MGFLERFEKNVERVVTGAFSRTFKSELQPVEIAGFIRQEMDSKASVVSRERILAPNTFTVFLSTPDFERMKALGMSLIVELEELATKHARQQKFQFGDTLAIKLLEDPTLGLGQVTVQSTTAQYEVSWVPVLDFSGKRHLLVGSRTTVGRDDSADIRVDDSGLSRKHFEILWDGKKAAVHDLGSTNGTRVAGRAVTNLGIVPETVISAGRTDFVFRVIAKAKTDE